MATTYLSLPLSINATGFYWSAPTDYPTTDWTDYAAEPQGVRVIGEARRPGWIPTLTVHITAPAAHLRWLLSRESGDGDGRSLLAWCLEGVGEVSGQDVDALRAELELLLVDAARVVAEREEALV